ncbi:MAG: hypothetical protein ABEJ87_05705 [Candidatus Nanohalobium sp.]
MSVSMQDSGQLLISELGFSGEELDRVEGETGLVLERTFDRLEDVTLEEGKDATTEAVEDETVLFYDGDISVPTLGHEAVHGEMLHPDQEVELPGEDIFHQRIYGEFVAYLAEDMLGDARPEQEALDVYDGMRHRCRVDPGVEDLDDLYGQIHEAESDRTREVIADFQKEREDVLAAYAASEHEETGSIRPYLDPDETLYRETVDYVLDKEEEIIDDV